VRQNFLLKSKETSPHPLRSGRGCDRHEMGSFGQVFLHDSCTFRSDDVSARPRIGAGICHAHEHALVMLMTSLNDPYAVPAPTSVHLDDVQR